MSELKVVGRSYPQIDALEKASGHTRYVSDLVRPGMLHGRVLRSPYPHARLLDLDPSRARSLIGVKAVVTYQDTPRIRFGPRTEDWTIFAADKVRFCGDEVAAVAAVDEDTAEEALDLIRVEYEELPGVFDPIAAMEPGAPLVHEDKPRNLAAEFTLDVGDVDRAFQESYAVYEDQYYTNQVYQAYLEPMGALVDVDYSGRITMWAGTQIPSMLRVTYAKALGVSMDDIRVIVPDYGGGFGAKFETNVHLIAAVLARKTGCPVRVFNTSPEDFIAGNPRVPMHFQVKLGATRDGILTAKEVRIHGAAGARMVYAFAIVSTACYRIDSLYRFPNVRAKGYTVYTHTVPTSCFRGFGNAQSTFVVDSALDMLAHQLGLDPAEIRLRNAIGPGEKSLHGWEIKNSGLKECILKATRAAGWAEKRQRKEPYRGIGLSCCNHVSGNRPFSPDFDGGAGIVRVGRDGLVTVYHGESDMGQGQKTAFAQIAAERLGVPLERIQVAPVDTDISPFGLGSFATRGTFMGGNGVLAAAGEAFRQLAETAAEMLEANTADIECREGSFFVRGTPEKTLPFRTVCDKAVLARRGAPVVGVGFYDPKTVMPDPKTKYGNISPAYPFACHVAEVEVDPDTGQVTLTNFVAAHDVGRAINPLATEGQAQGGVVQGLGWALMEDMITRNGVLLNPGFLDYIIPTALDVPDITPILVEPIEPDGPYGAKGIGEPALNPVMSAITNAIYDAIGFRVKELPVSAEKILAELKKQRP
ncbi:MAG: xanthine dehydrogenase family protein molybdopterin-binding subunit [Thermodesulfobacteriota bacterium]